MRLGKDSFISSYLPQLLLSKRRVAEGGTPGQAECGGLCGGDERDTEGPQGTAGEGPQGTAENVWVEKKQLGCREGNSLKAGRRKV